MSAKFTKECIKIPSVEHGVNLDVWFYKPTESGPGPFPVVVAGHGMSVIKEAGLATFGEEWASAGWASLIFDYRGFGASDGERNVLILKKELADYKSVINWAKRPEMSETLRGDKVVVMGSALSGLHIAELACSPDVDIAGAMAHCPLLDAYATLMAGPTNPRLLFWAAVDWMGSKLGLSPLFVPVVGKPGEFAVLNTPSCHKGFVDMFAQGDLPFTQSPNKLAPRLCFEMLGARSGLKLKNTRCPVLVVMAEEDDMIPAKITREVVGKALGKVKLEVAPGGHFDIMKGGKGFEVNITAQLDFLRSIGSQ